MMLLMQKSGFCSTAKFNQGLMKSSGPNGQPIVSS